ASGPRRVAGGPAQPAVPLLRRRQPRLDEVGVGVPDLVRRVLALEAPFLDALAKGVEVELARPVAAALDRRGGVGVGGVEVVVGHRDAELAQVAQERLVLLDVRVAALLAPLDLPRAVDLADPPETLDP